MFLKITSMGFIWLLAVFAIFHLKNYNNQIYLRERIFCNFSFEKIIMIIFIKVLEIFRIRSQSGQKQDVMLKFLESGFSCKVILMVQWLRHLPYAHMVWVWFPVKAFLLWFFLWKNAKKLQYPNKSDRCNFFECKVAKNPHTQINLIVTIFSGKNLKKILILKWIQYLWFSKTRKFFKVFLILVKP